MFFFFVFPSVCHSLISILYCCMSCWFLYCISIPPYLFPLMSSFNILFLSFPLDPPSHALISILYRCTHCCFLYCISIVPSFVPLMSFLSVPHFRSPVLAYRCISHPLPRPLSLPFLAVLYLSFQPAVMAPRLPHRHHCPSLTISNGGAAR